MGPVNVVKKEGFVQGRITKGPVRHPKFYEAPEGIENVNLGPDEMAKLTANGTIRQVSRPKFDTPPPEDTTISAEPELKDSQIASTAEICTETSNVFTVSEQNPEVLLKQLSEALKVKGGNLMVTGVQNADGTYTPLRDCKVKGLEIVYPSPESKGVSFE